MKIIHAIFFFNIGGAETMLVDIINRQCKEASVSLIIINDLINIDLLNTIDKQVNVFLINRKKSNKIQLLPAFIKINQIVNKINPDAIHCHINTLLPFFIRWKRRTFLTVHSKQLSTLFFKKYRQVFAISAVVKDDIRKRTGIEAKIIYNGIALKDYQFRNNYNFNPVQEVFKIIQVSRLSQEKGQYIAIESMRFLKEQHPDIQLQLFFVGGGDTLTELQTLAIRYNLQDRITFIGQVDRRWVKTLLKDYHVLIQPSLVEGFGLTVIEGFACGLPVIASDLDGPKEIIETLHSGLLVIPNNPVDLADKIYQVYQAYISNTLKDSNYILKDKNQLKIFDIQTTAKLYMNHYVL